MRGGLFRACVFGLSVASASRVARAQVTGTRLAWVRGDGAERCPDGEALARAVSSRLGVDPFRAEASLSIEALVEREEGRWSAALYARDRSGALVGARELTSEAADCAPIFAASTLAVALAIDPALALRPPPEPTAAAPSARPPAPAAPAPAATPPAPTAATPEVAQRTITPERPRTRRTRPNVAVAVGGAVSIGALPGVAPGVWFHADGALYERLRWSVGVLYLPETVASANGSAHGFGLSAGALGVCVTALEGRRGGLAGCARGSLGALHATVYRAMPVEPGDSLWAALTAGALARVVIVAPLAIELGADATVPLLRRRFLTEESTDPVFQPSVVAVNVWVGAGLWFR